MDVTFSNVVIIVYSESNKEECSTERLAAELSAEYLNSGRRCKCLPLNLLLGPNSGSDTSINGFCNNVDSTCELLEIGTNRGNQSRNTTLHSLIFILNDHSSSNTLTNLKNTLRDWLYDFRFDKSPFSSLYVTFVLDECNSCDMKDSVLELKKLFTSLGSKILHDDVFSLRCGDVCKLVLLINQIQESQDEVLFSLLNNEQPASEGDDSEEEFDIENLGQSQKGMVSDKQRESLIKQGYKLIGEHSAVKLCRWTKCRVRGHGGCYKHTFYGINSNQCMEFTPSLACANKCVFCWRHHTNPTATRWKWKEDDPKFILDEAIKAHLRLIKELSGIFDTKEERFNEAMKIRHCALSLVGEPIMYPRINELLMELHKNEISTFLVTNAQFPNEIENLVPVTQLYLSIDASDEKSLKNIDRPLFRDFWNRFQKCIQNIKNRRERTVFRLTMVLDYNMTDQKTEIEGYANLIKIGEPDFVEIKAVTYCGTVHNNAITMKNVPWHDQIIEYAMALIEVSEFTRNNYAIACEHRHSCCILIAKKSYYIDGKWHTWIDYPLFNKLVLDGNVFNGLEYSCETPKWAIFGAKEQGFDPDDTRVYTKGRNKHRRNQSVNGVT